MARSSKFQTFMPWSGGLVTAVDPIIADANFCSQLDNIVFTSSGSRRKRPGQVRFTTAAISTASTFVYGTDYWATVSNAKRAAAVVARANASSSVAGSVYRSISWVSTGFSNFNTIALRIDLGGVTSCVFNNDLIMGFKSNGTTCLRVWNDQASSSNLVLMTAASGTLPGRCWIVQENRRRLFVAGDISSPDTLYFSAVGDRTRWAGSTSSRGGSLVIGTENDKDPQGITAIMPGINEEAALYVAKRSSLFKVDISDSNPDNWSVTLLTDGVGCVNPNAFDTVDQLDICFVSDRGAHLMSQVLNGTAFREGAFLSAPVHYDFQNVIDATYRDRINVTWFAPLNSVLIACKLADNSAMDAVYCYNIEVGPSGQPYGWYRWVDVPCNFLWKRFNSTSQIIELYGVGERTDLTSTDRGRVNKLNQDRRYDFTTSTAIVTTIKTMNIYPDPMIFEKAFLSLAFIYRGRDNSSFSVQYAIDGIQVNPSLTYQQYFLGGFVLGSGTLGVGIMGALPLGIKPNFQHIRGVGNEIQATINHTTADADMEIFGMIIEYQDAGESQNAFRKVST